MELKGVLSLLLITNLALSSYRVPDCLTPGPSTTVSDRFTTEAGPDRESRESLIELLTAVFYGLTNLHYSLISFSAACVLLMKPISIQLAGLKAPPGA